MRLPLFFLLSSNECVHAINASLTNHQLFSSIMFTSLLLYEFKWLPNRYQPNWTTKVHLLLLFSSNRVMSASVFRHPGRDYITRYYPTTTLAVLTTPDTHRWYADGFFHYNSELWRLNCESMKLSQIGQHCTLTNVYEKREAMFRGCMQQLRSTRIDWYIGYLNVWVYSCNTKIIFNSDGVKQRGSQTDR